jgi:hypothetical protein
MPPLFGQSSARVVQSAESTQYVPVEEKQGKCMDFNKPSRRWNGKKKPKEVIKLLGNRNGQIWRCQDTSPKHVIDS